MCCLWMWLASRLTRLTALDKQAGCSSLGSGSVDAFVYVPGENFTFEHYTCAYFAGEGLAALDTYGDEYEDRLDQLVSSLDPPGPGARAGPV